MKQATVTKILTLASHPKKKCRRLSVQPGLCGSNDLRFGRKMATFQLFLSGRDNDLPAPLQQELALPFTSGSSSWHCLQFAMHRTQNSTRIPAILIFLWYSSVPPGRLGHSSSKLVTFTSTRTLPSSLLTNDHATQHRADICSTAYKQQV